jgi:hypothetical protein
MSGFMCECSVQSIHGLALKAGTKRTRGIYVWVMSAKASVQHERYTWGLCVNVGVRRHGNPVARTECTRGFQCVDVVFEGKSNPGPARKARVESIICVDVVFEGTAIQWHA